MKLRSLTLFAAVATAAQPLRATESAISSGIFTGDSDSGVTTSKIYLAAANVIGGDVTVNGVTFIGSGAGLSGAGWALAGLPNTFGSGGNKTTTFGASTIDDLFDGFQYGGNPGTLTLSGLTPGQTYVTTLYQQSWSLPDDRTNLFRTGDGTLGLYDSDGVEASTMRFTFVASGPTATLDFKETRTNYTIHFYGLTNEQTFSNAWSPNSGNSWHTAANWATGIVPNAAGSSAKFSPQAGPTSVTVGVPTTTGHVEFQGTGAYTVSGAGSLTLQADKGGVSVLKADAGAAHTISTPVVLESDLVKYGTGTVTLAGAVSGNRSVRVGNGLLRFGATNSYTGGTTVDFNSSLDLHGTSQNLGTLNGGGAIHNDQASTVSIATVTGGTFTGSLNNNTGVGGTLGLTKAGPGTLTLTGGNSYSGPTSITGGTLRVRANVAPILRDNFNTFGTPNTFDINVNLANRQTGTAGTQPWTATGNQQLGNPTYVQQPSGTGGDYMLSAFGGAATLNGLPLSTANVPGPLKIGFDMFKGTADDPTDWTSFTLRAAGGNGFPITGAGEFGFLYRTNSGTQMFSSGGLIQDSASTTGTDEWGFYLSDLTGTGSPFSGTGTRIIVTKDDAVIANLTLPVAMSGSRFLTFGSGGTRIGGVDNLAIQPFQTNDNVLPSSTNLSVAADATFRLDAIHQTVASLSGPSGSTVNLGPFGRLTVSGSTNTTFGGTIQGDYAGVIKSGNGSLVLSGSNTYSGDTVVNGGTLSVSGSLANTLRVDVNGGILAGTGIINPAAEVAVSATGTIAPGLSGIGTLSIGPISLSLNSTVALEIGTTTGDQLLISGGGNFLGNVKLELSLLADPVDSFNFTLLDASAPINYVGGARFSYSGNVLDEGELFQVVSGPFSQSFQITYAGNGGNDVVIQSVPEPGSAALLLLGSLAFVRRRRS